MQDKLSSNIFYQMLYQGFSFLFPLLTTPLISRAFGAEVLGIYSYTYVIAFYFSLAAVLGIHNYGSRLVAIHRDNIRELKTLFNELFSLQLFCTALTVFVYLIYLSRLSDYDQTASLLQGIIIITALFDISWFFSGMEQFKLMVLRNTFIKVASLVFIYLFVHSKEDLNIYIVIMTLTGLVGQLATWPALQQSVGLPVVTIHGIKKHITQVIRLFLPVIAINAYTLIDKTFLAFFRTMNEVGYYENSERLIRMPIGLVNAASAVLLPRAAYFIAHGEGKKNNNLVIKSMKYIMMLVIPIAIGLVGIAAELVPWYLGNDFYPCINIITMLSPIIVCMSVSSILRLQYYIPNKLDTQYTVSIVSSAAINLVITGLLTYSWGIYGVICGSVVSEVFSSIYLLWGARKDLNYKGLMPILVYSLVDSMVMFIVVKKIGQLLGSGFMSNIIQIVGGFLLYSAIMATGMLASRKWKEFYNEKD